MRWWRRWDFAVITLFEVFASEIFLINRSDFHMQTTKFRALFKYKQERGSHGKSGNKDDFVPVSVYQSNPDLYAKECNKIPAIAALVRDDEPP